MTAEQILAEQSHRPFALPKTRWVIRQEWHHLLFAHWRVPPETLRPLVPAPLNLDLWEGQAYLAVTPFVIRRHRPRGLPPFPPLSDFPEVNVRTYVEYRGMPGVFFFSLDAASLPAVLGARTFYHLPYYQARMKVETQDARVDYQSLRRDDRGTTELRVNYAPISEPLPWQSPATALERFLCERYCLYAANGRRLYRAHIHHVPWPIQQASAEFQVNTMTAPVNLPLPGPPSLLHFSRMIDVLIWWPERLI